MLLTWLWLALALSCCRMASASSDSITSIDGMAPVHDYSGYADDEEEIETYLRLVPEKVDRLAHIRRAWKMSPLIQLDELLLEDPLFLRNLVGDESPAAFVISIVASSPACQATNEALYAVAKSYWAELERRRSVSTSRVYFMVLNATKPGASRLVKEFKIDKVPTTILIPRAGQLPSSGQILPEDWFLDPSQQQSTQELVAWIEANVDDVKFPPILPPNLVGTTANFIEDNGVYIIFFQVLVIFATNAYRFNNRMAWLFLSLVIYFLSISGCIYCVLRGASPFGYSEQYGFMFIYPDRGGQFLFEGLIIGVFNILVSASFVVASFFALGDDVIGKLEAWFDGVQYREEISMRADRSDIYEKLYKTAYMCIAVGLIFSLNIWVIFKRKAPWYSPFSF